MKNKLKRIAASVLTLALLAVRCWLRRSLSGAAL